MKYLNNEVTFKEMLILHLASNPNVITMVSEKHSMRINSQILINQADIIIEEMKRNEHQETSSKN